LHLSYFKTAGVLSDQKNVKSPKFYLFLGREYTVYIFEIMYVLIPLYIKIFFVLFPALFHELQQISLLQRPTLLGSNEVPGPIILKEPNEDCREPYSQICRVLYLTLFCVNQWEEEKYFILLRYWLKTKGFLPVSLYSNLRL
jgi:hypothetical protein